MDVNATNNPLEPGGGARLTPARGAARIAADADPAAQGLSEEEKQEVARLKQRDAEVRRHEAAHVAAAGHYANGGANFEYTRGPDGRLYASGGEVSIDVSKESTPEATIEKAAVVRRAALAPAQPSGQDRAAAAQAGRLESAARRELAAARREEAAKQGESAETPLDILRAQRQATPDAGSEDFTAPRRLDLRG